MPMHVQRTRETLAHNLRYLMDQGGYSQERLAEKADVSQRTISNMLNPEAHSPTLETLDAVASAFGLNLWHLIMPTLIDDLQADTSIRAVYNAYWRASPAGRAHILRIAEREAEYQQSNPERTGSD